MREREDANRTREAGNLDEIQGVVANTLNLHRNGASLLAKAFGVGFIDWLDQWVRQVPSRLLLPLPEVHPLYEKPQHKGHLTEERREGNIADDAVVSRQQ